MLVVGSAVGGRIQVCAGVCAVVVDVDTPEEGQGLWDGERAGALKANVLHAVVGLGEVEVSTAVRAGSVEPEHWHGRLGQGDGTHSVTG